MAMKSLKFTTKAIWNVVLGALEWLFEFLIEWVVGKAVPFSTY